MVVLQGVHLVWFLLQPCNLKQVSFITNTVLLNAYVHTRMVCHVQGCFIVLLQLTFCPFRIMHFFSQKKLYGFISMFVVESKFLLGKQSTLPLTIIVAMCNYCQSLSRLCCVLQVYIC